MNCEEYTKGKRAHKHLKKRLWRKSHQMNGYGNKGTSRQSNTGAHQRKQKSQLAAQRKAEASKPKRRLPTNKQARERCQKQIKPKSTYKYRGRDVEEVSLWVYKS